MKEICQGVPTPWNLYTQTLLFHETADWRSQFGMTKLIAFRRFVVILSPHFIIRCPSQNYVNWPECESAAHIPLCPPRHCVWRVTSNFAITLPRTAYENWPTKTISAVNLLHNLPRRKYAMIVSHNVNLTVTLISCVTLLLNPVAQMWKVNLNYPGSSQPIHCHNDCETTTDRRNECPFRLTRIV